MTYPADIDETERRIIDVIVKDILAAGHKIEVYGSGELDLKASSDYEEITENIGITAETSFHIPKIGWINLIHGNGYHVLSDHTSSPTMDALLNRAFDLSECLEGEQS